MAGLIRSERRRSKSIGNRLYVFPVVVDAMDDSNTEIITIVNPIKVTRGHHTFPFEFNNLTLL